MKMTLSWRRSLTFLVLCLPLLHSQPTVSQKLSRVELDAIPRDFTVFNVTYESCCTTHFYWMDDGDFTWGDERNHYELYFYGDDGSLLFDPTRPAGQRDFSLHVLENHKANFHAGRDYIAIIKMGIMPHDRRALPFHTPAIPPVNNLQLTPLSPTSLKISWEPFHFDGCEEEKWSYILAATSEHGGAEEPIQDCDVTANVCEHILHDLHAGHDYDITMETVYDGTEAGTVAHASVFMPYGAGDLKADVKNPCMVELTWTVDFEDSDFMSITVFDETAQRELETIPVATKMGDNTFHLDVLERQATYIPDHTHKAVLHYGQISDETTFVTTRFPQVDLHTVSVSDTYADIEWHPFHFEGCRADHWVYVFKITHDHWGNMLPEFPIQDCNVVDDLCVHRFDGLWACANHEVTVHARYNENEYSVVPYAEAAFTTTKPVLRPPIITTEYYTYNHTVHLEWKDPPNFGFETCTPDETFFYKVFCEVNNLKSCIQVSDSDYVPRHYLRTTQRSAEIQLTHPYSSYTCHIQGYSEESIHSEHPYDYTGYSADIDFMTFPEVSPAVKTVQILPSTLTSNSVRVSIERPNCMYFDYIDGIQAKVTDVKTGVEAFRYITLNQFAHPDVTHYEFDLKGLDPNTIYRVTARLHTLPGFGLWTDTAYDVFETSQ